MAPIKVPRVNPRREKDAKTATARIITAVSLHKTARAATQREENMETKPPRTKSKYDNEPMVKARGSARPVGFTFIFFKKN